MKCKRCGEPLDPRDTHCPVCGRAVSGRKKAPAPKKNENNMIKLPQLDKFTHTYAQDTLRSSLLQLVTIAAVAAAIVLAAMVYTGIGSLRDSIEQLRLTADAQLQLLQNQTEPADETEPEADETEPPTDGPTEPEVLPLSRQDLTAALSLYRTDNGTYAAAAMNPSYAEAWVNTVREGSARRTNAAWIIRSTGDRLTVRLHDSYGGEALQAELTLNWTLTGETFSAFGGGVCVWEYRISGGEWESLPNECVTTDLAGGTTRLALTADRLNMLLGQQERLELRCQIAQTNPDGGSLRIIADGITIGAEGPVSAGSLLD